MLVLASASPRRRALLERAGLRFQVVPADIPESAQPGEAPAALAERLAREKALAVAVRLSAGHVVVGSDTIVVLGRRVLGKPRDAAHARELLGRLQGRTHSVISGVAVVQQRGALVASRTVTSQVTMHPIDAEEIRRYVATGEPLDKAGAYALQGAGGRFVARVSGSETNVIGLPMEETLALLRQAGVATADGQIDAPEPDPA